MNKKKILIVNKSFELGGIQMALVNMLQALKDEYDISIAIFNPNGPLHKEVPDCIHQIELHPLVQTLGMSVNECMHMGSMRQKLFKLLSSVWAKLFGNYIPIKYALIRQKRIGKYDIAISYHQEQNSRTMVAGFGQFVLEKVEADRKIAWVHADFQQTGTYSKRILNTYRCFDRIVCVSQVSMLSFETVFPELKGMCTYCYNYLPENIIIENSFKRENVFQNRKDSFIIFSAGRLVKEKGYIDALEQLKPFFRDNRACKWYIAGNGPEKENILSTISSCGLDNQVFLIGYTDNPYPYIRECDCLFIPSKHETFSMVVAEAHILDTIVVASDIPVMHEVLNDNDILCINNKFSVYLEKIYNKHHIKKSFESNINSNYSEWQKAFFNAIDF